jgi:release factor glutamine methyltransferase
MLLGPHPRVKPGAGSSPLPKGEGSARDAHTILRMIALQLEQAGIETPELDARLLMQHALDMSREMLVASPDRSVSDAELERLQMIVSRRAAREPLAQIIGVKGFWRDDFIVTRDVLTPRPDSETLIEALLQQRPDRLQPYEILDFGAGSGCLLLSLLREYPNAKGTGIDQSEAALDIARQNAKRLGLQERTDFRRGNWGETLQTRYDMIISNPPYIAELDFSALAPEVREYEPKTALTGGTDGLAAYRDLLPHLARCLKPSGISAVELGAGQACAVSEIAAETGLTVVATIPDLGGIDRALIIKITKD